MSVEAREYTRGMTKRIASLAALSLLVLAGCREGAPAKPAAESKAMGASNIAPASAEAPAAPAPAPDAGAKPAEPVGNPAEPVGQPAEPVGSH